MIEKLFPIEPEDQKSTVCIGALDIINIRNYLPENAKTLIISSKRSFETEKMKKLLSEMRNEFIICDSVVPNPDIDEIDDLIGEFSNKDIGFILSIGGGSIIDTGKALSLAIHSNNSFKFNDIFREKQHLDFVSKVPCYAVPTTAGTGSEFTPFATIWDKKHNKKYSLDHEIVSPDFVLLDSELTLSLSYLNTLFGALDSTSHSLESIWNVNATEHSRKFSFHALKLIVDSLPKLLRDLLNPDLRKKMLFASCNAGIAISITRTAIAHSISYPITAHFNVPHGLACSFTLESILKENIDSLSHNKEEAAVLNDILEILSDLELGSMMREYLSHSDLESLYQEMITKNRAKNFTGQFTLEDIVSHSIRLE